MSGQHIGYKRVSSVDQKLDRQLNDVAGIDRMFEDKESGSIKDRPELLRCLSYVREGDTLHVHSIDRLARNTAHMLEIVKELTDKGVSIIFHKENLTFSDNPSSMDKFTLNIFSAVAEFERELIRERQAEGIALAKANGTYFGRKPIPKAKRQKISDAIGKGTEKKLIADAFGVAISTVYNIARERENAKAEQTV